MKNNKQKKNNIIIKKRILQAIIVLYSLIVFVISLIVMASTVKVSNLAFGRTQFYIMKSQAYPEIAQYGDLVIVEKQDPGQIKAGDNIVYKDGEFYFCETVKNVRKENIVNKVIIAEKNGIRYQFDESDIRGKVVKNIHELGFIISFIRTPLGIVFYVLLVACIFALLRILISYSRTNDNKQEANDDK